MSKIPDIRNVSDLPEGCVGIVTGKCLGETCSHFSVCVAKVIGETAEAWGIRPNVSGQAFESSSDDGSR
ncbi:MAG: hypothetical protein QG650_767 [Patescibacteria group bacterium]|nr:hypothetical protein [Patescibacteria group bacterium]